MLGPELHLRHAGRGSGTCAHTEHSNRDYPKEAGGMDFVMVSIISITCTPTHVQRLMCKCTQVYKHAHKSTHTHTNSSACKCTSHFGHGWIKRSNVFRRKTLVQTLSGCTIGSYVCT